VADQIVGIYAASNGAVDDIQVKDVQRFEAEFLQFLKQQHADVIEGINKEKKLTDDIKAKLEKAITEFKATFEPTK
jgi:F-type H+-transporting ATPase subunit alpha